MALPFHQSKLSHLLLQIKYKIHVDYFYTYGEYEKSRTIIFFKVF